MLVTAIWKEIRDIISRNGSEIEVREQAAERAEMLQNKFKQI
jgi:hypothetical protein